MEFPFVATLHASAQVSLYLQTVLSAACEDVQDGSVFSYPNAVTLDIGARGSVPSDVVTVPHQVYCEGTNWNTSKVSQKDCGAPVSEPDKTDWRQQQQQQVEGTHATLNDVNGLHLIGVDPRLSGASGTAGDKGWPPVFQGKMETIATNLWEISANSGSVICEAECKIISGLAAAEYLIEQHFVIDNAVLGKQLRNGVWAISSPETEGCRPDWRTRGSQVLLFIPSDDLFRHFFIDILIVDIDLHTLNFIGNCAHMLLRTKLV